METITYSQVQELVSKIPVSKLPIVYRLLIDISKQEVEVPSPQYEFMQMPEDERRIKLEQQATQMAAYYDQTEDERQLWQAGDFKDEY